ncbi:MAG: helix-turn-helix transcriptional regulator [Cyanobacteria bacterium J06638_22]
MSDEKTIHQLFVDLQSVAPTFVEMMRRAANEGHRDGDKGIYEQYWELVEAVRIRIDALVSQGKTIKLVTSLSDIHWVRSVSSTLIRWKLREVMEANGIQAKELAAALGVSQNAVSNLRGSDMPRIDGDRLNGILLELNKRRRNGSAVIMPSDLIEFTLKPDEAKEINV